MSVDALDQVINKKIYEARFNENIEPLKIKITGSELSDTDLSQIIKNHLPPTRENDTIWLVVKPYTLSFHEVSEDGPEPEIAES